MQKKVNEPAVTQVESLFANFNNPASKDKLPNSNIATQSKNKIIEVKQAPAVKQSNPFAFYQGLPSGSDSLPVKDVARADTTFEEVVAEDPLDEDRSVRGPKRGSSEFRAS